MQVSSRQHIGTHSEREGEGETDRETAPMGPTATEEREPTEQKGAPRVPLKKGKLA